MQDIEEHEKIEDKSKNEFEKVTDKGLLQYSALNQGDKIKIEMSRRLKKEIKRFNYQSSRQTKWIIYLTWAMSLVGIANIGLLVYSLFTQA